MAAPVARRVPRHGPGSLPDTRAAASGTRRDRASREGHPLCAPHVALPDPPRCPCDSPKLRVPVGSCLPPPGVHSLHALASARASLDGRPGLHPAPPKEKQTDVLGRHRLTWEQLGARGRAREPGLEARLVAMLRGRDALAAEPGGLGCGQGRLGRLERVSSELLAGSPSAEWYPGAPCPSPSSPLWWQKRPLLADGWRGGRSRACDRLGGHPSVKWTLATLVCRDEKAKATGPVQSPVAGARALAAGSLSSLCGRVRFTGVWSTSVTLKAEGVASTASSPRVAF